MSPFQHRDYAPSSHERRRSSPRVAIIHAGRAGVLVALAARRGPAVLANEPGAGVLPVMCGTLPIHKELEDWLRDFLKMPDVILYGSGYHANIGIFAPLFGAKDCIIYGGVHPSLAEGARLAGARLVTFRSDDPDDLEDILRRSRWARLRAIVTNGVHPFTGRISDLASICDLAERYDAVVVVDDALAGSVSLLTPLETTVTAFAVSPQRTFMALGSLDGEIFAIDQQFRISPRRLEYAQHERISCLYFENETNLLVCLPNGRVMRVNVSASEFLM